MIRIPDSSVFESAGWVVHPWRDMKGQDVTVLHREPFRVSWFATRLVTYVFLIPRDVDNYADIIDEYASFRKFAGENKRTLLPFGIQCGYAILPVYMEDSFPNQLVEDVRSIYKKRWCVLYLPSLLETQTARLHTLEAKSFWGCIYRNYLRATLGEVVNLLLESRSAA